MILNQFDEEKKAVINPEDILSITDRKIENCPEIAISCFSSRTFERLVENLDASIVKTAEISGANGEKNIYKAKFNGMEVLLFMSYVGAPGCISILEEFKVYGVKKFVIFGTCGVLDKDIRDLSIIIPNSAVRDEGTSYHYKEASDEVEVNKKYIDEFKSILEEKKVNYTVGKVWTTDAFYRETSKKVAKRKKQGCIAVDMECSAIAAFAEFREVEVFQFFYSADNLDLQKWDNRSLGNNDKLEEKDRVAYLALLMAEKMNKH